LVLVLKPASPATNFQLEIATPVQLLYKTPGNHCDSGTAKKRLPKFSLSIIIRNYVPSTHLTSVIAVLQGELYENL
jgi:hypothetical protein